MYVYDYRWRLRCNKGEAATAKAIDRTVEKFYVIDLKWSCVVQTIVSSFPRINSPLAAFTVACLMPLPATSMSVPHFGPSVVQRVLDTVKEFQM